MTSPNRDPATVARALSGLAPDLAGPGATLVRVRPAGGNAGFSYLLDVGTDEGVRTLFLRLAPPGVRRAGTADLGRQSTALRALDPTEVPHPAVLAQGEHPLVGDYLVTSMVTGRARGERGSLAGVDRDVRDRMAGEAMTALAGIHAVPPRAVEGYLGPFAGAEQQVRRWDRFFLKGEYVEELGPDFQRARTLLLASAPAEPRLSLCHGDFQFGNLMFTDDGALTAVIDWELCEVAPALSDLGWVMAFHDRRAWGGLARESASYFDAEQLRALYRKAGGDSTGVEWYQALAHYKYAVIASLNLSLHRRGKRQDPEWERRGPGALTNMRYAVELLESC
ncbi:phosphotransferase family protein [Dactylosporangium sp. NPDC005572]|uniref:phosphotransferase family protein n=1 Tax=Dactylosporangium sp. NPDC005572 TaxID=3156889 RepID=UPI0033A57F6F